jgi:hypothetical protein
MEFGIAGGYHLRTFRDILTPMKTEEQIAARIKELHGKLKPLAEDPRRHKRGQPGHVGALGIKRIRELEGEIAGFEWV